MQSDYYLEQCNRYFDSLDTFANHKSKPTYAFDVIRFEWPPWLKLTGYGRRSMLLDVLVRLYPTKVINRKFEISSTQPLARCHVSFKYLGLSKLVDIYEEFTFNDSGEITFIEAWTDSAEVLATAGANTLKRLSTDREAADLRERMKHPVYYWLKEVVSKF